MRRVGPDFESDVKNTVKTRCQLCCKPIVLNDLVALFGFVPQDNLRAVRLHGRKLKMFNFSSSRPRGCPFFIISVLSILCVFIDIMALFASSRPYLSTSGYFCASSVLDHKLAQRFTVSLREREKPRPKPSPCGRGCLTLPRRLSVNSGGRVRDVRPFRSTLTQSCIRSELGLTFAVCSHTLQGDLGGTTKS
jgi:hypothetical protein